MKTIKCQHPPFTGLRRALPVRSPPPGLVHPHRHSVSGEPQGASCWLSSADPHSAGSCPLSCCHRPVCLLRLLLARGRCLEPLVRAGIDSPWALKEQVKPHVVLSGPGILAFCFFPLGKDRSAHGSHSSSLSVMSSSQVSLWLSRRMFWFHRNP